MAGWYKLGMNLVVTCSQQKLRTKAHFSPFSKTSLCEVIPPLNLEGNPTGLFGIFFSRKKKTQLCGKSIAIPVQNLLEKAQNLKTWDKRTRQKGGKREQDHRFCFHAKAGNLTDVEESLGETSWHGETENITANEKIF